MNIYQKLHKVKTQIGTIKKDSKNPFFKSNYLSLNGLLSAVEPLLEENGLLLLQPIKDGFLRTEIIDIESAEVIHSEILLPSLNDPQKLGSSVSYFRRYTLESLMGLASVDDDGNSASAKTTDRKPAITADQYQNLLKPENRKYIQTALDKYRMSAEQNKALNDLL